MAKNRSRHARHYRPEGKRVNLGPCGWGGGGGRREKPSNQQNPKKHDDRQTDKETENKTATEKKARVKNTFLQKELDKKGILQHMFKKTKKHMGHNLVYKKDKNRHLVHTKIGLIFFFKTEAKVARLSPIICTPMTTCRVGSSAQDTSFKKPAASPLSLPLAMSLKYAYPVTLFGVPYKKGDKKKMWQKHTVVKIRRK